MAHRENSGGVVVMSLVGISLALIRLSECSLPTQTSTQECVTISHGDTGVVSGLQSMAQSLVWYTICSTLPYDCQ